MREVIDGAGFEGVLDIRDFASLRPREHGALAWVFESARRLRADAAVVRDWMEENGIRAADSELWADDPSHFNVTFLKGLLRAARQVKFPHCFNLEDASAIATRAKLEADMRKSPLLKRLVFRPWLKFSTSVDSGPRAVLTYDTAYSFDLPSPWAEYRVDVSGLISIDAFRRTYEALPGTVRGSVEGVLAALNASRRPLVLLLLFGFDPAGKTLRSYQRAIARLFAEHAPELSGCTLAVKVHPATSGTDEELFFDWLGTAVPAYVVPVRSILNLEFMLPQLRPDYVLAGPCGALPIVKRLRIGRPILLREIMEETLDAYPAERGSHESLVSGIDVW